MKNYVGEILNGKYRVLRENSYGGGAVVYLGIDEGTNKTLALKAISKEASNYAQVYSAILATTKMLQQFDHPFLPKVDDLFETDDALWAVMEYSEGNTLNWYLKNNGPMPYQLAIHYGLQLAEGADYLHHSTPPYLCCGHLQPWNFIVNKKDGTLKICDIGWLVKYEPGNMNTVTYYLGTRGYVAPELYGGQCNLTPSTDVYGIGAILYYLVTGHDPSQPPFEMYPIRQWNPNLPVALERIITKCTQIDLKKRYQSCGDLIKALNYCKTQDAETFEPCKLSNLGIFRKIKERILF